MAQDMGLGGAGMLGAAFSGAPRLRQAAYQQERGLMAQAFERAAAAQKDQSVTALNQNRLDVLRSLSQTFRAAGMPQDKADLAAAAVAAASTSNPNQIIGAGQQLQAQDAGLGGDVQAMNVINSARTGTPLPMTKIEGNTAFNPNLSPDQDFATTPVGESTIDANKASVAERFARAASASAAARLSKVKADAGGFAPSRSGSHTAQDDADLAGFRQRIAAGKATPEQVSAFLVKQGRPDLAKKIFNPAYVVGGMYDDGEE